MKVTVRQGATIPVRTCPGCGKKVYAKSTTHPCPEWETDATREQHPF